MIEVIMCTFNGSEFIEAQLESILNQSLQPNIISIYDDCSTDDTLLKVECFKNRFLAVEFRVFINDVNKGYISNFKGALKNVHPSSKVIFLSDQDDEWLIDKVKIMVAKFTGGPQLVFSDAYITNFDGTPIGETLWNRLGYMHGNDLEHELLGRNVATGATIALTSSLLHQIDYDKFPLEVPHDYVLALLALNVGTLVGIPDRLIGYRQHSGNQIGVAVGFWSRLRAIFESLDRFDVVMILNRYSQIKFFLEDQGNTDWLINLESVIKFYKKLSESSLIGGILVIFNSAPRFLSKHSLIVKFIYFKLKC